MNHQISVIMTVYNQSKYLTEAMNSILLQTFQDFEFIIVNDASTDDSDKILRSVTDHRVHILRNEKNLGLAASLNNAIRQARGEYVARMDADDISEPQRLAKQVTFLVTNPTIDILGSDATIIKANGERKGRYRAFSTHTLIKWRSLFSSPLIHPSVMAKRTTLLAHPYDETYRNSQDYELWSRLLFTSAIRFANLPIPLLRYRMHGDSTSSKRTIQQKEQSLETTLRNMRRYASISDIEETALRSIRFGEKLSRHTSKIISQLYGRLAKNFLIREKTTYRERLFIHLYLFQSEWFLIKARIHSALTQRKDALHS